MPPTARSLLERSGPIAWLRRTLVRGRTSLTTAAGLRDSVLILGGGAYVLGYVVWSIYAWRQHLGLLPALRAQYLLAGLLPLLLFGLAALTIAGLAAFFDALRTVSPFVRYGIGGTLAAIGGLMFGVGLFALARNSSETAAAWILTLGEAMLFYGGAILSYTVLLTPSARPSLRGGRLSRQLARWNRVMVRTYLVFLLPGSVFAGMLFLYVLVLYPGIPQEFGGVRPQCSRLDLKSGEVSKHLLKLVGIPGRNGVVTTKAISVLFVGSDFTIARTKSGTIFRIKKDAVEAVERVPKRRC